MADWIGLVESCIITLIFAYMVVGLFAVVQSFLGNNLRIQRAHTDNNLEASEDEEERVAESSDSSQVTHTQAVDKPRALRTEGAPSERSHKNFGRDYANDALLLADAPFPSSGALVAGAHVPPDDPKDPTSPKKVMPKEEEESLLSDDEDWEGIEGSDLDKAFGKAASHLEKVALDPSTKMSNEVKLKFYALYKQATEGPCSSPQPPAFRLSARAKWNAWKGLGDVSPEEAMQRYIALLSELWPQWNQDIKNKVPAGSIEDSLAGSNRKTPGMGPVFSTMLSDASEQEGCLDGIHKCAKAGDLIGLEKLLEANAVVDVKDGDGRTALHWATDQGHLDIIKLLLSRGAEINARDSEGQTALHYATTCEWEEIATYLLESGADPSVVDNDGCTPYEHSSSFGNESAIVS